jgi:hypothetical protein
MFDFARTGAERTESGRVEGGLGLTDGGSPPWSPDMSGRVVRSAAFNVSAGKRKVSITLDRAAYDKLAANGSALISFETPHNEVQAFFFPLEGE